MVIYFFSLSHLFEPIHAVPVRSPSPKLTAGWPLGVGKVHDTRAAGLAGGPRMRPLTPAEGGGWRQGPCSALQRGDR